MHRPLDHSHDAQEWHMVWKMQSNSVGQLKQLMEILPAPRTHWAFLYREPVPVMVSLLKHKTRTVGSAKSVGARSHKLVLLFG